MVPRINKEKKTNTLYIVPDVYTVSLIKGRTINSVSIEDLIKTNRLLYDDAEVPLASYHIHVTDLLTYYCIILLTLLWGAQVKLNSKYQINRQSNDTSTEKTFQQTETHYNMVKILSNSIAAKVLLTSVSVQKAINNDYYGISEDESTDEGYMNAIAWDMTVVISEKGSGALNIHVKDVESRRAWLRASNSSLRSTWCSTPTYSPNKLASANISLKTVKPETMLDYIDKLFQNLLDGGIIKEDEIPSREHILSEIKGTIMTLNLNTGIDDTPQGTVGAIPLETIFGFERTSVVKTRKQNQPGIATVLKSNYAKKKTEPQASTNIMQPKKELTD